MDYFRRRDGITMTCKDCIEKPITKTLNINLDGRYSSDTGKIIIKGCDIHCLVLLNAYASWFSHGDKVKAGIKAKKELRLK